MSQNIHDELYIVFPYPYILYTVVPVSRYIVHCSASVTIFYLAILYGHFHFELWYLFNERFRTG